MVPKDTARTLATGNQLSRRLVMQARFCPSLQGRNELVALFRDARLVDRLAVQARDLGMLSDVGHGRRQERFDCSAPDRFTSAVERVIPQVVAESDQPPFIRTEPG